MKNISILIGLASCFLSGTNVRAIPVVEWNTVTINYQIVNAPTVSFGLYTQMDVVSGAAVFGDGQIDMGGLWTTLDAYGGTLGIAHRWFVVDYGELIDWETALASDAFADNMTAEYGSLYLEQGQSIYLGFQLGGASGQYGWAELYFDNYAVSVLSSATERTGLGIYAGTGTAVPEPATTGLLLMGTLALVWRKRRRVGRIPPCGKSSCYT